MTDRPNILWIMCDQLHAACLSVAGHPSVRTPNIDRLAAEGVRFTRAYAQSPVCLPSRISFLTGQHLRTHRQYGFMGMQDPDQQTLFKQFRGHGYRVGAFGKQHIHTLGPDWGVERCSPTLWAEQDYAVPPGRTYQAYLEAHGLNFPTAETHGTDFPATVFCDDVPEDAHPRRRSAGCSGIPLEHNLETWATNESLEFLESCRKTHEGEPFLVWLSFDRPHFPTALPEGWYERIRPEEVPELVRETVEQIRRKPRPLLLDKAGSPSVYSMSEADVRHLLATYFTLIELIDEQVGRVLDWLDSTGLAKSTHVIFTADHGDAAGVQGLTDKQLHVSSDAVIRIPLIWRPPGNDRTAERGRVVNDLVASVDLFPTLCALCDVPAPEGVEGHDLGPALAGTRLIGDRSVFSETYWRKAVVRGPWKLVHHVRRDVGELYNLDQDPGEYENLYEQPGHAQMVDDLKHELIRFFARPFGPEDSAYIDRHVFAQEHHHVKWRAWDPGREGERPAVISGRGLYLVQSGFVQLFYRVDNRQHRLYDVKADPRKVDNLIGTAAGRSHYASLRDALLDNLCLAVDPIDVLDPRPRGPGRPNEQDVLELLGHVRASGPGCAGPVN